MRPPKYRSYRRTRSACRLATRPSSFMFRRLSKSRESEDAPWRKFLIHLLTLCIEPIKQRQSLCDVLEISRWCIQRNQTHHDKLQSTPMSIAELAALPAMQEVVRLSDIDCHSSLTCKCGLPSAESELQERTERATRFPIS